MKTLFISALALFLSSQLFAQQWEKIQYPEIYYSSNKQNTRQPTLVVHNNIIIALPNNSLPLYTSKDNGSTWQMCDTNALKNLGLVHNGVLDWYISSIDFTKSAAFASISTYNGKVSRNFLGRSRDNGQTWQFIDLSGISQNAIDSNVYRVTADDRTVIVNTGDSYNTNLFISTDEGDTWKEMALPRNTVNANGQIALFQNSFMYEGRFYDGKEFISTGGAYNGRFLIFQDISNPISQKLSDFPKWADLSQKKNIMLIVIV
jgi:predicted neuraminidase